MSTDDVGLLREYVERGSGEAFARVVGKYVDMVYAAARRQVGGDPGLAEDVVQGVFMVLAEKSATIRKEGELGGWLLQVTRFAAANARRARGRQERRERKAAEMRQIEASAVAGEGGEAGWEEWGPLLDEGIGKLRAGERDALVLRYFEQRSHGEVARLLGITEAAAGRRVSRAVEKLRAFFARRGASVGAAGIVTGIMAHSAEAAPAGLAGSVAAGVTGGSSGSGAVVAIAKGASVAMTIAKVKSVVVGAAAGVVVLGVMGVGVVQLVGAGAVVSPVKVVGAVKGVTPWPVRFSNGDVVEVIGVTEYPDTGRWWAADGTPIPEPAQNVEHPGGPRWMGGEKGYRVLVRQESAGAIESYLGVGLKQMHRAEGTTGKAFGPSVRVISYVMSAPAELEKGDIGLFVSRGPWKVEDRYELKSAPVGATTAGEPWFKVIEVGEEEGKLTVRVESIAPAGMGSGEEQVVVLRGDGGREVPYSSSRSVEGGKVFQFGVAKGDGATLVHRWRPFERREVGNVSLREGVRTEVRGDEGK